MYNEEQKMRYLESESCKYEDATLESIKRYFNSLAPTEEYYKEDLIYFTRPQIIDMLKKVNSKSPKYLTTICIHCEDYYNWCLSEGIITNVVNPYVYNMTKDIIEEIIPQSVVSRKYFKKDELLEYISKVFDPTNKFILYSLYQGMSFDEIISIRIQDLNKEDNVLKLITGRVIKVDDYFIDLMEKANAMEYYDVDGDTKIDKHGIYSYAQTGYVLKPLARGDNNQISYAMFGIRLNAIKKQAGNPYLSIPTLYKNGLINYIIGKYAEQGITLETALFDAINKKIYTYDKQTQKYIDEFGSKLQVRFVRHELEDYMDSFK